MSPPENNINSSLADAIQLLECYRVILLQRPSASVGNHERDASLSEAAAPSQSGQESFPHEQNRKTQALSQLTQIGCMSWFVSPHGPSAWKPPNLWKSDLVEIKLQQWYEEHGRNSSCCSSTLILHHMICLNIHSNIDLLQRHARSVAKTRCLPTQANVFHTIERWRSSRQYAICTWHATKILILGISDLTEVEHVGSRPNLSPEPPHVPFCIYFATLVLWYGAAGRPDHEQQQRLKLGGSCIEIGARLLSNLKAHVAIHLRRALHELAPG